MTETREEFYVRCIKDNGYICPSNRFDHPDFSVTSFADTCNPNWCPYYRSICQHFGGKRKTPAQRRRLVERIMECQNV